MPVTSLYVGKFGELVFHQPQQIPTFLFLYFAGWIGHSGRKYLQATKEEAKPVEKEIIIDYPLALSCIRAGLGWPVDVIAELRTGKLLADDKEITISPR